MTSNFTPDQADQLEENLAEGIAEEERLEKEEVNGDDAGKVYDSLSGIPIVGPAMGAVAAAAVEKFEEGTEILDPELKAKSEKQKAVNDTVTAFQEELFSTYGMKSIIAGWDNELDNGGLWKCKELSEIETLGLSKLVEYNV